MSRLPRIYASWYLIACSCFLALLPAIGLGADAPSSRVELLPDPSAEHAYHELAAPVEATEEVVQLNSVGKFHRMEDPPDLVRTAVVPGIHQQPVTASPEQGGLPAWFAPQGPDFGPRGGNYAPQGNFPGSYLPNLQPTAPPVLAPQPMQPAAPEESPQLRITSRYSDPKILRLLERTSMQEVTAFYMEASQLIDTRHVQPPGYEMRVQAALAGLQEAVANTSFLRAGGANPAPQQIDAVRGELAQLASQPASNANEAVGIMQYASEIVSQRLGVRREAVAMEFVNATLDSLDKYSAFVPSKTAMAPSASLEENIVGIGVELKTHEQGALIIGVIAGGPAAQVGMAKGDILVAVNGKSIAGMTLSQAADMISGPANSIVNIHIRRNGQKYGADLARRKVYVGSVTGAQMVDTSVGYVRLKQFSESSAEDLEKAMWELYRQGMRSLVLDLRGNPGGLLTESIEVSDLFLPSGVIVSTKGRTEQDNSEERAKFEKTWSLPLVVLVDENSASASEILAAAIQDNRRGVLVGRTSYGKGTVQTHFPLRSVNGTLKLTTAKFYSPSGREMAGQGVTPDVPVQHSNSDTVNTIIEDTDVQAGIQTIQNGSAAQLAAGN